MVIGYHLIWTAYGWWLPNDPRGSSSHEIRVERIKHLGPLLYGRQHPQPAADEVREFHEQARDLLAHEVLAFGNDDIALLGRTIGEVVRREDYTCHACAVMPEHIHLLIARHRDWAETMLEKLQHAGKKALQQAGRRGPVHPVWGGKGWKVFLQTPEDMKRIEKYIADNPIKAGRPRQNWDFVRAFDGSIRWLGGRMP